MGFAEVYDYAAGKADWLARGLPREGRKAAESRAIDVVRDDVVTCGPADRIGAVRDRVAQSRYGFAFVVSEGRVLLGRLRHDALERDPDATAEDVMEPGPSTVRADAQPSALAARLRSEDLMYAVVTDPDGRLLGIVQRDELEARGRDAVA
jgi:Mg/Co/Ni transporter MgtE